MSNHFLTLVLHHSKAVGSARMVITVLADKANDSGIAWPSVSTIALLSNISTRQTQYNLRKLAKDGEIISVGSGEHGTTKYQITINGEAQPVSEVQPVSERGCNQLRVEGEANCTQPLNNPTDTPKELINRREDEIISARVEVIPPTIITVKAKVTTGSKASKREIDADFEQFWQQCPRKVGKGGAQKAFQTALKKADFQTLLAGIMRYSAECDKKGTEAQFIAYPQTWLNQKRWLDESTPDQAPARGFGSKPSKIEQIAARLYKNIENENGSTMQ